MAKGPRKAETYRAARRNACVTVKVYPDGGISERFDRTKFKPRVGANVLGFYYSRGKKYPYSSKRQQERWNDHYS